MFVISHPSIETKSEQFPVFLSNDCWFFQYHIFLLTHFPNQICVSGSHSLYTRSKMRCHPSCNSVHQALPLLLFSRDSFRIVPTTACSCCLQVLLLLSISIYIACSRQSFADRCLQLTELQDWISSQSYQFACSSAQCGGGGGCLGVWKWTFSCPRTTGSLVSACYHFKLSLTFLLFVGYGKFSS